MTVNLSALAGAGQQFFDNNGVILAGGKLYSYAAGTTTPAATYTSSSGGTAHTNPIIFDSAGRVPSGEIWLTAGSSYKFTLNTSTNILIATYDNISGINDQTAINAALLAYEASIAASTGSSLVGYLPAGTGAVASTTQNKLREHVSVKDFGAVGNGIADDTAAIQACINAGTVGNYVGGYTVYFPSGTYKISGTLVSGVRRLLFLGDGTIGPSGTTLQQTNANADFFQSTYDSFSCYGMTFRGTDTTGMGVGTSNGLVIGQAPAGTGQRCFSGHISNCYFVFIPQASIKLVNAEDFHIHGNTIEITRYGIQLVQADQINIIDNTLYGCLDAGVYFQQGSDNKITANNFYLCGHAAGAGQITRGGFVANYSTTVESTTLNIVANNFNQCNIDVTLTGGVISNPTTHIGLNFVNIANNISRFADAQSIYINGPSNVKIAGHYFVDANYAAYSNTDGIAVYNSASSSCNGVKNVIVAASPNAVRYGLYVDSGNTAFRYGNDNYFSGLTASRLFVTTSVMLFENLVTLATAELKPASSAADGEVVLEETALAQKNLIYYVGGSRFRVSGTSF